MKEINFPICSSTLSVRIAKGRKSNTDQPYVKRVLAEQPLQGMGTGSG